MRGFWIGLGVLFAVVVGGILGLNLWVNGYLRSAAFRQLVTAKSGEALRADVDCLPLEWSGSTAYSAAFTARGSADSPLESLDAEQVRANVDWRAIFDGAWRVNRIDVTRLAVKIRTGRPGSVPVAAAEAGPKPDAVPPRRSFLPSRFELRQVAVQDASVQIGGIGQLSRMGLTVEPEGSGWIFNGTGGRFEMPERPPLEMGRVRVRLQQGAVYLTEATARLGVNGALTAAGEIGGSRGPFDFHMVWQGVDVADLLDETWRTRLTGSLGGEAQIQGREGLPPKAKGTFHFTEGRLQALPVQREIAQFTRTPQFEQLALREISGNFTTDGVTTKIESLVVDSPGLLRIEGNCKIGEGGSLRGTFQVGVTPQTLQWLPGSQEKVFITARDGYLWTEVRVGGTIEKPSEDLSRRLAQAMGEQVINTGLQILNGAPDGASDAVKRAVDLLSPLIR